MHTTHDTCATFVFIVHVFCVIGNCCSLDMFLILYFSKSFLFVLYRHSLLNSDLYGLSIH